MGGRGEGVCEAMPGEVIASEMVRPRGRQVPYHSSGICPSSPLSFEGSSQPGFDADLGGVDIRIKESTMSGGDLLDSAGGERRTNWIYDRIDRRVGEWRMDGAVERRGARRRLDEL